MSKRRNDKLNETIRLLNKVAQGPNSVSNAEKERIKKLIGNDMSLMIEALQTMQKEQGLGYGSDTPLSPHDDSRTLEEIIADNYVALAKFTIDKMQLKNVSNLKVIDTDCCFTIYALTPEPVELDLIQFATSDYPNNKELLLEAEALQSDLSMDDSSGKYRIKIIQLIENSAL